MSHPTIHTVMDHDERQHHADGALSGSMLANMACQATPCRVEVDPRAPMALDRFLDEFPATLGWNTNSYARTVTHEGGSATLVLYISRESYRLLRPDA